jgi:hypothetical protein
MRIKSGDVAIEAEAGGKVYAEPALHLKEQGFTPSTAAGEGTLFVDSGDGSLKFRAESDGAVTNLLGVGGAGVVSYGRMGTDAVAAFVATPGAYNPGFIYLGVSGWPNNTVTGAPYVTFVADGTNGDYFLIGASGGGKYLLQFTGSVDEQTPGGPEVVGGWFFAFSVNNVNTGPASAGYGVGSLTEPFTVSYQVVLDLVPTDQVRLELSSWGAVNTLNIGGEFIMARMEAGENLAQTLTIGNTTGGTDLEVSAGDVILMGESAAPTTAANQGGIFVDPADNKLKYREESNGTITDLTVGGGPGSDTTAIHDNVSAEISAITEKVTPVSADLLLIEDSAASNVKKRVQVGNLPGGGGLAASYGYGAFQNASIYGVSLGAGVWTKWSRLEFAIVAGAPYITFVNQAAPNADYLLVGASGAGVYHVWASGIGYLTGAPNDSLDIAIVKNTSRGPTVGRFLGAASPRGGFSIGGYWSLIAGDQISVELFNRDVSLRSFSGQIGLGMHRIG